MDFGVTILTITKMSHQNANIDLQKVYTVKKLNEWVGDDLIEPKQY